MPTALDISLIETASQAMKAAAKKGILPTDLSSADVREFIAKAVREISVFSARTTSAHYVGAIQQAVIRILQGGTDNDWAKVRLDLMELLKRLQYTPEEGFPGDDALGIPPAEPGSLRDISSEKRIDFVLRHQIALVRNYSYRARAMTPERLSLYPAWELVRVETRMVPRGAEGSPSIGWQRRWLTAGGPALQSGRLVAAKSDPVWAGLGDSTLFSDAMDVEVPPFAFNSGMGWREVQWDEAMRLGVRVPRTQVLPGRSPKQKAAAALPPAPKAGIKDLDDPVARALLDQINARETARGEVQLRDYVADQIRKEAA